MNQADLAVVIPTIPIRTVEFRRAVESVRAQTLQPHTLRVATDLDRKGAAHTRQRALDAINPEIGWVAFLDDDDELYPGHLLKLYHCAQDTGADYVYSWYDVIGGVDPLASWFGVPWDNQRPHQTTITVLVRRDLAQQVGFLHPPDGDSIDGQTWGEDYQFTLGCVQAGAKIVHLPERTWAWHHHGQNTSGRPDRW